MQRIIVLDFDNNDVTLGLTELVKTYPKSLLLIPVTVNRTFVETAIQVAIDNDCSYSLYFSDADDLTEKHEKLAQDIVIASNPVKEVIREITPDDILAIAWDDSVEAHMVLHSVEDFGLETWNILGELQPLEIESGDDSDDLYEDMQEALTHFIDVFAAYIAAGVIETIGKTVESFILEHSNRDDLEDEE